MPKLLSEQPTNCPACGNPTILKTYSHEIPVVGTVLMFVLICEKCGYKYRDTVPVAYAGKPIKIRFHIETPEDLNTLIYKSPYAHVLIPRLDIEIAPGPANPGEITTLDGILLHIAEHLFPLCDTTDNPEKCYEVVRVLTSIANGDMKTDVEIFDPSGLSTVIKSYREKNYEIEILETASQ